MNWLQIRPFGPYFSSFSINSYGYYSQMSQNLISNDQVFASAQIVRQAASLLQNSEAVKILYLQPVFPEPPIACLEPSSEYCNDQTTRHIPLNLPGCADRLVVGRD